MRLNDELFLGIDGGGTTTKAAITRQDGSVMAFGLGGPSNYDDVGIETTRQSIANAVSELWQLVGLDVQPFRAVFLGMAGVVAPKDRQIILDIATGLNLAPGDRIQIDHDARAALAGGLSGRPGIILIAGTGSCCYGRTTSGESWRAGGWGHQISDEGSSYWLGIQAMRQAVMAYDGRTPGTLLQGEIMTYLQLTDMNDIMHRIYSIGLSRSETAALAPLVIKTARLGDPVALRLLDQAADDLAECILAVARQLKFDTAPLIEVALSGGLIRAGDIMIQPLASAVAMRLTRARLLLAELPPVLGACILALKESVVQVDPSVAGTMLQTAPTSPGYERIK